MSRWIMASAAAAAVAFTLACGGAGGGGNNVAACKAWLEKQNALPCASMMQMNAADVCPDSLDQTPIDMESYYNCMAENAKCNGDFPDLAGQANCSPM